MSRLVLLDCDDVLLDYLPGITKFLTRLGYAPDPAGPGCFDLAPWIGVDRQEASSIIRRFNETEGSGFDRLEPVPGAVEAVRCLREAGYSLRIISSFSQRGDVIRRREANLEYHFGRDAFEGIDAVSLGACKAGILRRHPASPFIDDLLANVMAAAAAGHSGILFRAHHNATDFLNPRLPTTILRAENWSAALAQIDPDLCEEQFPVDNLDATAFMV